ncbi:hypothetical protein [Rhodococcus aetherivorans]
MGIGDNAMGRKPEEQGATQRGRAGNHRVDVGDGGTGGVGAGRIPVTVQGCMSDFPLPVGGADGEWGPVCPVGISAARHKMAVGPVL